MPKKISSTELQQKTKKVIDQVRFGKEPVVIYHYNQPVAVLAQYKENYPGQEGQEDHKKPPLKTLRKYIHSHGKTDAAKFYRKLRDAE
jgi:prevent-host-death family protein